jgi:hypothetical protein
LLFLPLCGGCIGQLIKIYENWTNGEIRLAQALRNQSVSVIG